MIWKNVQLFNVVATEIREDGALYLRRFPLPCYEEFSRSPYEVVPLAASLTTGCELRFVGSSADIYLSAEEFDGTVEIYRGDFFCRVERLEAGVVKKIELRPTPIKTHNPPLSGRFSPNVWRVIFDHDLRVVLHDVQSQEEIRPPVDGETPRKKIIAYGSSITHSAGAQLFTNSYIYPVGKKLDADVLCKGMGGSCLIHNSVVEYLPSEQWDVAILELGINMIDLFPVEVFEERARDLISKMIACNKPVILISNFTSYRSLKTDNLCQVNASYIATLEKLYEELKTENLYYIKGEDIVTEWDYLTSDLLHPSPYGHGEMGRKIAKIIREEFKIL
jgi:hypothetical protein